MQHVHHQVIVLIAPCIRKPELVFNCQMVRADCALCIDQHFDDTGSGRLECNRDLRLSGGRSVSKSPASPQSMVATFPTNPAGGLRKSSRSTRKLLLAWRAKRKRKPKNGGRNRNHRCGSDGSSGGRVPHGQGKPVQRR